MITMIITVIVVNKENTGSQRLGKVGLNYARVIGWELKHDFK